MPLLLFGSRRERRHGPFKRAVKFVLLVRIEKTTQRLFLLLAGVLKQCENASRRRRRGATFQSASESA
jgi:hypothetical protein